MGASGFLESIADSFWRFDRYFHGLDRVLLDPGLLAILGRTIIVLGCVVVILGGYALVVRRRGTPDVE